MESNSIHWPRLMESVGEQTIKAVSSGTTHTLVLDTDGRVSSLGKQTYGRLGRRDADCNSDAPLGPGPVDNLEDVKVTGVVAGELALVSLLDDEGLSEPAWLDT